MPSAIQGCLHIRVYTTPAATFITISQHRLTQDAVHRVL